MKKDPTLKHLPETQLRIEERPRDEIWDRLWSRILSDLALPSRDQEDDDLAVAA